MWFTRLAINRPILIWMALLAIAVLGLEAYSRLPAELNPRTDIPTLTVTTIYPGAGPPEIESQISKPLEDAVGTVPGVRDVYSSSQANVSIISMDFLVGTDLDTAVNDVRGRIETVRAQLPPEARPPVVAKLDINALPILYLGMTSDSLDLRQLRSLADNTIRPRLERVPGVATVQVVGGEQREIHVNVDPQKLSQFGLTIEDVVNSLKAAGRDVPGGGITYGPHETDVRLVGAFSTLQSIRGTQILSQQLSMAAGSRDQSSANGGVKLPAPPITVADVASVADTQAERTEINRVNGRDGISLVFTKAADSNTVAVVDGVKKALDQARSVLPSGLHTVILRDDSQTVRAALEDVDFTLVLGAFLAMVVILLYLHNLRGTLIVSLAIPSCIIATFLVMWIARFTLNQMTLLALSLSVGILVDDSIVVLESITRHLRNGETPKEAAFNGRTEIGFADITTTLVDVVVFVPIAFMGGIVGGFFKQFGLTIAAATLFSLVVSFTVTPMLASRWYKTGEDVEAKTGVFSGFERFYQYLERAYRRIIRWSLAHRAPIVAIGVAALLIVGILASTRLGTDLLPSTDQGQIAIGIEMPPGTALVATDDVARTIEREVSRIPEVESYVTNIGQIIAGFGEIPQRGAQFAQINVHLKPKVGVTAFARRQPGRRTRTDQEVAKQLRGVVERIAAGLDARITATALRSVEAVASDILLELRSTDMDQLTRYSEHVRDRMRAIPGVLNPNVSVRSGKPELRAVIDRQKAAQLNIPPAVAGSILRDSIEGNTDTVYRDQGQEFPVRVQLAGIRTDDPSGIRNVVVGSDPQGQPVLLGDVALIEAQTGPSNIDRNNGERLVTVSANLAPNVPLGDAQRQIEQLVKKTIPPGVDWKWSGTAETLTENIPYFINALALAVVLVYIVMASLFNALRTPFVIMFTLPMAMVGAIGALVLTGETMSLVSGIGIIMLTGLMGRNAILLLDFTNTLRARGESRNEAIEEAGATRLRPILMTTTATIVGMLPVALRIGEASEVRAPMAIVVIGGLLVSTVLTLIVIPVVYSLFEDWFDRGKRAKSQQD